MADKQHLRFTLCVLFEIHVILCGWFKNHKFLDVYNISTRIQKFFFNFHTQNVYTIIQLILFLKVCSYKDEQQIYDVNLNTEYEHSEYMYRLYEQIVEYQQGQCTGIICLIISAYIQQYRQTFCRLNTSKGSVQG